MKSKTNNLVLTYAGILLDKIWHHRKTLAYISMAIILVPITLELGKDACLVYSNTGIPVIFLPKETIPNAANTCLKLENSPRLPPRKLPLKIGANYKKHPLFLPFNYEQQSVILDGWMIKGNGQYDISVSGPEVFSTGKDNCPIRPQHDSENISRLPDFNHLPCSKTTHFFMVSVDKKSNNILALRQIEALQIVSFITPDKLLLDRRIQVYDLNGRALYQIRRKIELIRYANEETLFTDLGPTNSLSSSMVRPPRNLLSFTTYEIVKIPPVAHFLCWLASLDPRFMRYTPPFLV